MIENKAQWLRNQQEMLAYWFHLEWRARRGLRLVTLLEENQTILLEKQNVEGDKPGNYWINLMRITEPIPT